MNPPSQRAGDGGEHHHDHHVAHVTPALARRHDVAQGGHRADHQPAGAQALDGPEGDQLGHRLRQAGQRRPDQEDHDREDEELLPPVHVAELAVERRGDQGREDVGGHHPGQVRHPAEVADDPRQRGAHDQVVEHGQQDGEQQPGQYDHHLARREELPAARLSWPGRLRAALPVHPRPRCFRHVLSPSSAVVRFPSAPGCFPSAIAPATLLTGRQVIMLGCELTGRQVNSAQLREGVRNRHAGRGIRSA